MKFLKSYKLFEQDETGNIVNDYVIGQSNNTSNTKPSTYILNDGQRKNPDDQLQFFRIDRAGEDSFTINRSWKTKTGQGYATVSRYDPKKDVKRPIKAPRKYKPKGTHTPKSYRYAKTGLAKMFNPKGKPAKGSTTRR